MNDYCTGVVPRAAAIPFQRLLGVMPVAVVTGPRQAGKTTLARGLSDPGRVYLTMDDVELRTIALESPMDLLGRAPRLILDEVQRTPDLLLAIKQVIDAEPRSPGRFILTGSANLLLMERVSESLAGRAGYLTLWPLTRREVLGAGTTGLWSELLAEPAKRWPDIIAARNAVKEDWRELARRGGFPTPALQLGDAADRAIWFNSYIQTYLERDLQTLANIDALGDFRRVMRAAALRIGQVINQTEVARDVGVTRPTAHRYLNLLETSYQILRIEAYSVNRTRRLIKSPKLYWCDVGLSMAVAGVSEPTGAHLENIVASDLCAWRDQRLDRPGVYYWRTVEGTEVDFVIEQGDHILPIEVKATAKPQYRDAVALNSFANEYGKAFRGGLLLHDGSDTFWMADRILAVPWWKVL